MEDEPKVVSAAFQASVGPRRSGVGQAIERAMADAILQANAEGISTSEENSVELKRRMMEAREEVKRRMR